MKHVPWKPHVITCFIWILPAFDLNYKTCQVLKVLILIFAPDFEDTGETNKFLATDVLSVQQVYDLFLLNQEIDTPSDNLNHQDIHVCEQQGKDDFLINTTNLSHSFAQPNS